MDFFQTLRYVLSVGSLISVQLLSIVFIESDFIIIIYIPYTYLRVCNKRMLFLMCDFLAPKRPIYLVKMGKNMDSSCRFLYPFLTSK